MRNYYWCCGTQIGTGWGPGLTREPACSMERGAVVISMREFDPRRFGSWATKEWQVVEAKEDDCPRHEIPFPHCNRLAGRPVEPAPPHEWLAAREAAFEAVHGHERACRFAPEGVEQTDRYAFRHNVVHDDVALSTRCPHAGQLTSCCPTHPQQRESHA